MNSRATIDYSRVSRRTITSRVKHDGNNLIDIDLRLITEKQGGYATKRTNSEKDEEKEKRLNQKGNGK